MRGFPPIQIFLLCLAFSLFAFPLAQLTGNRAPAGPESATGPQAEVQGGAEHPEAEHKHVEVASVLRLRFAHRPLTLSLKQEGRELLKQPDLGASPVELEAQLEISHDGNEMLLAATWPEGTPDTAVTVEIEPDGFETRSETRWSSGAELNEVIAFQW